MFYELSTKVLEVKAFPWFGRSQIILDKSTLRLHLEAFLGHSPFNHHRNKIDLERELQPWVVSNLEAFPELVSEPFVFANMMAVSQLLNQRGLCR